MTNHLLTELPGLSLPTAGSDLGPVPPDQLPALLEALLLVAPQPAPLRDLAEAAGVPVDAVQVALERLQAEDDRGWVIVLHQGTAQLASAPRFAAHVRRFLRIEREPRLSGASLETLALVAYRQPVTRAEIEALRGVDCSGVLATLHARGLIEIAGRLPTVGNPIQYVTSPDFLRLFGLNSLRDLPSLESLGDDEVTKRISRSHAESAPDDAAPTSC